MTEYTGHFEVHLTACTGDRGDTARFADWCRGRGLKCVHIVLARGESADQPMATWRRSSTRLSAVLAEADRLAGVAVAAGFAVVRLKVEADPSNADVPVSDDAADTHPPECYFEHHVKLRRPPDTPRDALLAVCERHMAHLSRNAFRDDGEVEERFVTQRAYGVGRLTAAVRLDRLLTELRRIGEDVIESESEFCVSDTNLNLDAGWLPG
jgi:hypothetical protein